MIPVIVVVIRILGIAYRLYQKYERVMDAISEAKARWAQATGAIESDDTVIEISEYQSYSTASGKHRKRKVMKDGVHGQTVARDMTINELVVAHALIDNEQNDKCGGTFLQDECNPCADWINAFETAPFDDDWRNSDVFQFFGMDDFEPKSWITYSPDTPSALHTMDLDGETAPYGSYNYIPLQFEIDSIVEIRNFIQPGADLQPEDAMLDPFADTYVETRGFRYRDVDGALFDPFVPTLPGDDYHVGPSSTSAWLHGNGWFGLQWNPGYAAQTRPFYDPDESVEEYRLSHWNLIIDIFWTMRPSGDQHANYPAHSNPRFFGGYAQGFYAPGNESYQDIPASHLETRLPPESYYYGANLLEGVHFCPNLAHYSEGVPDPTPLFNSDFMEWSIGVYFSLAPVWRANGPKNTEPDCFQEYTQPRYGMVHFHGPRNVDGVDTALVTAPVDSGFINCDDLSVRDYASRDGRGDFLGWGDLGIDADVFYALNNEISRWVIDGAGQPLQTGISGEGVAYYDRIVCTGFQDQDLAEAIDAWQAYDLPRLSLIIAVWLAEGGTPLYGPLVYEENQHLEYLYL